MDGDVSLAWVDLVAIVAAALPVETDADADAGLLDVPLRVSTALHLVAEANEQVAHGALEAARRAVQQRLGFEEKVDAAIEAPAPRGASPAPWVIHEHRGSATCWRRALAGGQTLYTVTADVAGAQVPPAVDYGQASAMSAWLVYGGTEAST